MLWGPFYISHTVPNQLQDAKATAEEGDPLAANAIPVAAVRFFDI